MVHCALIKLAGFVFFFFLGGGGGGVFLVQCAIQQVLMGLAGFCLFVCFGTVCNAVSINEVSSFGTVFNTEGY